VRGEWDLVVEEKCWGGREGESDERDGEGVGCKLREGERELDLEISGSLGRFEEV